MKVFLASITSIRLHNCIPSLHQNNEDEALYRVVIKSIVILYIVHTYYMFLTQFNVDILYIVPIYYMFLTHFGI